MSIGSRYEYVRGYERDEPLLPGCYIAVRIDGRGFGALAAAHGWAKPWDARAMGLMAAAAAAVLEAWGDALLAFGHSDEFSFLLPPRAAPFGRRPAKIGSGIASLFAAAFALRWADFFPGVPLSPPPAFDARCVAYPGLPLAADYCRWRQVDAYVNAMYNEAFWALQQRGGRSAAQAHAQLMGTSAADKHELLHSHGLNFAKLPAAVRRGLTIVRAQDQAAAAWLLAGAGGEAAAAAEGGAGGGGGGGAEAAAAGGAGAAAADAAAPLPDIDPGVDLGPLVLPRTLRLCFPDFIRSDFLLRGLAER